jgi:hypothetical protein
VSSHVPASRPPTVSRRVVLAGAGALTVTALVPIDGGRWVRALTAVAEPLERRVARRLVGLLPDPSALHALGRRALATSAGEPDLSSLVRAIALSAPGGVAALAAAPARELRNHLAAVHDRELRDGEVVVIDGWVTAAIEARLAALAVLLEQRDRPDR